jgi:isopenicillin N synthase-like dioxygenase
MAIATLDPQPDPSHPSSTAAASSTLTLIEEVQAAQSHLRTRLAGAVTKPPANVPESALPTVPLVDLGPSFNSSVSSRQAVASEIRNACLTTGFFQISNHGITEPAISSVMKQAKRFFHELTPVQKQELHVKHSPLFRGYEPSDATYVNVDDHGTTNGSPVETKEGFNWGYESSLDPTGGDGHYVELDGQPPSPGHNNVWPSESLLPGFHDGIKQYYTEVLQLARHLFRLFALSLNLEEAYFDELTTHPGGIGRLLYYPPQPSAVELSDTEREMDGKLGLGAHTDYECFTLLLNSPAPGLEILFPPSTLTGGKPIWRPCPIRPGTLTVNVADFLMRWTNGLYKSTIHRVVTRPGMGERYSVPFFFSINYDSDVGPLPEKAVGPSKFKPMKAGEYVLERLRATTNGEQEDGEVKRRL